MTFLYPSIKLEILGLSRSYNDTINDNLDAFIFTKEIKILTQIIEMHSIAFCADNKQIFNEDKNKDTNILMHFSTSENDPNFRFIYDVEMHGFHCYRSLHSKSIDQIENLLFNNKNQYSVNQPCAIDKLFSKTEVVQNSYLKNLAITICLNSDISDILKYNKSEDIVEWHYDRGSLKIKDLSSIQVEQLNDEIELFEL